MHGCPQICTLLDTVILTDLHAHFSVEGTYTHKPCNWRSSAGNHTACHTLTCDTECLLLVQLWVVVKVK